MHIDGRSGTRVTVRIAVASAAAGAVLLLAGCGSSDADSSISNDGGATTSRFSPLDEFLTPTDGGQPLGEEDYAAKEKQLQELVTACMTAQGFDYVPFVYPMSTSTAQTEMDPESRDWVAKYGYGISTIDQGPMGGSPEVADPNQAIVEAMSDGERQAYLIALYGGEMAAMAESSSAATAEPAPPEASATDLPAPETVSSPASPTAAAESDPVSIPLESVDMSGMSMPALQDQGCWGQAQAEAYGDINGGLNSPDVQAQFQSMWDAYGAMYSDLEADPRVTAALAVWTDCMAAAGHPDLTGAWDAPQQVNDKWAELNGYDAAVSGDGGSMMSVAESTSAVPSTPPADEVAAFKEYEIALALADWDCKDSSGYNTVSNEVRIELETAFLQEHRSELEQYRDLMNGGG